MALVAWYRFDDNVLDSSKNELHGIPYNIAFANGIVGRDALFTNAGPGDPASSLIVVNNIMPYIVNSNRFSVFGWIRQSGGENDSFVNFNDSTGFTNRLLSRVGVDGYFYVNDGAQWVLISSSVVNDNVWHHVGFTYDKNLSSGNFEIFVDGVSEGRADSTNVTFSSTDLCSIGQEFDSGNDIPDDISDIFGGEMADIRIYNHVPSLKEIKELSMAKVLHYEFNFDRSEGMDYILDSSDYGHNIQNAPFNPPTWLEDTVMNNGCYFFPSGSSARMKATGKEFPVTFNTNTISISFWVIVASFATDSVIFHGRYAGTGVLGYYFAFLTNSIRWSTNNDSANDFVHNLQVGQWYHIVATYDGTDAKTYIDSILVDSHDPTNNDIGAVAGLTIGNFANLIGPTFFDGKLADFRIYNKVLELDDIEGLYQKRAVIDNKGNLWC